MPITRQHDVRAGLLLTGLLVMLLLMAACGGNPVPTATPAPSVVPPTATSLPPTPTIPVPVSVREITPEQTARIFIVNALDVPASADGTPISNVQTSIDVYAETTLLGTNLSVGRLSASFGIGAGGYTLRVLPRGARVDSTPLTQRQATFTAGSQTIFTVTGNPTVPESIRFEPITPILTPVEPDSGRAAVVLLGRAAQPELNLSVQLDDQALTATGAIFRAGDKTLRLLSGAQSIVEVPLTLAAFTSSLYFVTPDPLADGGYRVETFRAATERQMKLRFVHAAAEIGAVDVTLGDGNLAEKIYFRQSTEYVLFTPKAYMLRVRVVGGDPGVAPLLEQNITLNADQATTIILVTQPTQQGSTTQGNQAGYVPLIRLYNEDQTPLSAGRVRLTAYNAIRSANTMNGSAGGQLVPGLDNIAAGTFSAAADLPEASYVLSFDGQISGSSPRALERADGVKLLAGNAYLYVVVGNAADAGGANNAPLLLPTDLGFGQAQDTISIDTPDVPADLMRVRVINAVKDNLPFDLQIGDQTFSDVRRRDSVPGVFVKAPVVSFTIMRPGEKSGEKTPLLTQSFTFTGGTQVTIIVTGTLNEPTQPLDALYVPDRRKVTDNSTLIRVVHAAPGYNATSILLTTTQTRSVSGTETPPRELVPLFTYPSVTDAYILPSGTVTFGARDNVIGGVQAALENVELKRGLRYDLLFVSEEGLPKLVLVSSSW